MRVSKWGDSLAVRLPKRLVAKLGVGAGDALEIVEAQDGRIRVRKAEALRALDAFRIALPADYRFDRDEANSR